MGLHVLELEEERGYCGGKCLDIKEVRVGIDTVLFVVNEL